MKKPKFKIEVLDQVGSSLLEKLILGDSPPESQGVLFKIKLRNALKTKR